MRKIIKKRHTVKVHHAKGLHGFIFHRTVNCLKETAPQKACLG